MLNYKCVTLVKIENQLIFDDRNNHLTAINCNDFKDIYSVKLIDDEDDYSYFFSAFEF